MSLPIVDRAASTAHPPLSKSKARMLRCSQVAEILDVPEKRVYVLAREGIIPHVRVGRSIRFNEAELEEWIAAGGAGYPEGDE